MHRFIYGIGAILPISSKTEIHHRRGTVVYFPYQRALEGMFDIYQRIFGLKFYRLDAPYNG